MLKQILVGSSLCAGLWMVALPSQAQSSGQQAPDVQTPATQPPAAQPPAAQPQPATPEAAPAGSDVSQTEIEQFANAIEQFQSIQSGAQQQANQILQEEQLSPERFNQIMQTQQNPEAQPSSEISAEEREKFDRVSTQLGELQESTRTQMEQALQQEGLPRERFAEILAMVRQDATLRQRIEQEMQN